MRLDELLEARKLDALDDDVKLFAAAPYAAESLAFAGDQAPPDLRFVCLAREAKAMLAPFAEDPIGMRVARFRATAERVDMERKASERDARTFCFQGKAVGYFEDGVPTRAGAYRYMPFRGSGHLAMMEALQRRERPMCTMNRCRFSVVGIPQIHTIELSDWVAT